MLDLPKLRYKVAIIGNGKLAKAIAMAFLNAKFTPGQIIVIGSRETSDISWCKDLQIHASTNMSEVITATHIILAVTPQASGYVLDRLSNVSLEPLWGYEIISFVSGLYPRQISNFINSDVRHRVICATGNTNIAYGHGILCANRQSEILPYIADVRVFRNISDVLKMIVAVGSFNAIHSTAIQIAHRQSMYSVEKWIRCLRFSMQNFKQQRQINSEDPQRLIKEYIYNVRNVFVEKLECNEVAAFDLALGTFHSTLNTIDEMVKRGIEDPMETHKKTVVTKGGCTERGVDKILTPDQITSRDFLSHEVVDPIWEAASDFPNIVSASLEKIRA